MSRPRSRDWLKRHDADPFVRQSRAQGYRARSVYKLIELDEKLKIFRRGGYVLDLGAAPGSWSQYAASRVTGSGKVVAVDRLPIAPISGVSIIQADICAPDIIETLGLELAERKVDVLISDMAPDITGISVADAAAFSEIADAVRALSRTMLIPGGIMVFKVFEGLESQAIAKEFSTSFAALRRYKPKASLGRSRELYFIGSGFRL